MYPKLICCCLSVLFCLLRLPSPCSSSAPESSFYVVTPAVTKTKQQDSFYFDPSPINQDVVDGGEALLRCDVSNRRQITFYWTINGRQLANTSRRYQDDSNLRIVRVDRSQDAGSFRCIATNVTTGIALRSTEAKLNISCESFHIFFLCTSLSQ